MARHFLDLNDAGGDALAAMINDAIDRKAARAGRPKGAADDDAPLAGRVLAMIFEKNSTRTRVSFDMAMRQLGGSAIVMESGSMQLGRGESIADTARVLSRMADAIMIRTDDHAKIEEMARHATVPVINGLTDRSHPCQIVADLLTIVERRKPLPGLEVAWLGDGNNVLHSILEAAGLMKFNVRVGTPAGYEPDPEFIAFARENGAQVTLTNDPATAADGAQLILWASTAGSGRRLPEKLRGVMQRPLQLLYLGCLSFGLHATQLPLLLRIRMLFLLLLLGCLGQLRREGSAQNCALQR